MSEPRLFVRLIWAAVVIAGGCSLASCGFTPMYAKPDSATATPVTSAMSAIQIRPIADHDGVKLRQMLRESFQPRGPAPQYLYDLDVQMRAVTQELGIRKDATSSRANRIYSARFALFQNGRRVFGDQVQTIVSYNIADDQYATVASVSDASDRAIRQIGEQITTRVALYLKSQENKSADETSKDPVASAMP
jgi:LPS-assembly lipoprotein